MNSIWQKLVHVLQIQIGPISLAERAVSIAGGFIGIFLVLIISNAALGLTGASMLVGSMGASAVLLFAAPHGVMAQPWSVFGGHLISALIGVSCAQLIADPILAAACAVAIAIFCMQLLGCLHPPGGATALVAVLGGDEVLTLGYQFVLTPVLFNAAVLLIIAVVINLPFRWRRYPVAMMPSLKATAREYQKPYKDISHADFVAALSEVDSFIDITEHDLLRIYDLVTRRAKNDPPED